MNAELWLLPYFLFLPTGGYLYLFGHQGQVSIDLQLHLVLPVAN